MNNTRFTGSSECKKPGTFITFITKGQFERRMNEVERELDDVFEDVMDLEEDLDKINQLNVGYEAERILQSICSLYNQSIDRELPIVRGYIVEACKTILTAHELDSKVEFGHRGG